MKDRKTVKQRNCVKVLNLSKLMQLFLRSVIQYANEPEYVINFNE